MTVIEFTPNAKEATSNRRSSSLGKTQVRIDEFWAARRNQNALRNRNALKNKAFTN